MKSMLTSRGIVNAAPKYFIGCAHMIYKIQSHCKLTSSLIHNINLKSQAI